MKLLATIILFMVCISAFAEKTYTPGELNRMVDNGQYPEQGPVSNTETKSISFSDCILAVEDIMSQIRDLYPAETIVDTGLVYMVKAWTNDGAITATCSKSDKEMVLTVAPYR